MINQNFSLLRVAQRYANLVSHCQKVKVGTTILHDKQLILGANVVIPEGCDGVGCNRVLPHDGLPHCVSTIHSEVHAIIKAKRDLYGATIYVTRYPCENCARSIVMAGIKKVVYGRPPEISEDTKRIFESSNIEVIHIPNFNPESE